MRYIIGNWKMNLTKSESVSLAESLVCDFAGDSNNAVQMVLCPSFLALDAVGKIIAGTSIALGAQDVFWAEKGSYTGEVSVKDLKAFGCNFCIVGHSERREYLGETDDMVNKKIILLLKEDLIPIVCVGETREERQSGKHVASVVNAIRTALHNTSLTGNQKIIIAYEPRWVIGRGEAIAPQEAAEMLHLIKETLIDIYGNDIVSRLCSVVYGGSVNQQNIVDFLSLSVASGALVGSASLKKDEFIAIAEQAVDIKE